MTNLTVHFEGDCRDSREWRGKSRNSQAGDQSPRRCTVTPTSDSSSRLPIMRKTQKAMLPRVRVKGCPKNALHGRGTAEEVHTSLIHKLCGSFLPVCQKRKAWRVARLPLCSRNQLAAGKFCTNLLPTSSTRLCDKSKTATWKGAGCEKSRAQSVPCLRSWSCCARTWSNKDHQTVTTQPSQARQPSRTPASLHASMAQVALAAASTYASRLPHDPCSTTSDGMINEQFWCTTGECNRCDKAGR